ncbi:MAG: fibronectin type III domain-containing protein [Lachnospiraceae bacterium]|nr:fibronectin type III domain-containing protein [Lachnospiraceae bacterium]
MKRVLSLIIATSLILSLFIAFPVSTKAVYKANIACVGDSITYGYGREDTRSFPYKLGVLLNDTYNVKSFGEGGKTLMSTGDTPYIYCSQYQPSIEYESDVVLIMLGTNDGKYFNWNSNTSPAILKRDLKALVQVYRNLPNKPSVFIMTSPTAFNNGGASIVPENVEVIAQLQREVAEEINAPLIDMHAFTADMGVYFEDNIHPNEEGYALMAQFIADAIREYVGELPGPPKNFSVRNNSGRCIVTWEPGRTGGVPILSFNVYVNGEFRGNTQNAMFNVKDLTNGETYELKITSVNKAGESEMSEAVLLQPTASDPKVTGITDGAEYDLADGAPKASWKTATNVTLDGEPYEKDAPITAVGAHTLVVTNDNVVVTISFTVVDTRSPSGDMDGDGEITVADALAVLRIAAKLVAETPAALSTGDMDGDGEITVSDALRVLRIAAKLV